MASLSDMIVRPFGSDDERGIVTWIVERGSRRFVVMRSDRGDWETLDSFSTGDVVLDVSGDLSGSLEYIEGLFT